MTDQELNQFAFDVFLFAKRMFLESYDVKISAAEDERYFELLRDIAEGRATIVSSPAEQAQQLPPHMVEYLARNSGKLIAKDRKLAQHVLTGYQSI